MRALGREDLKGIFITHAHADHYGGAAELRRITGAPIVAHGSDAPAMAMGDSPLVLGRRLGRPVVRLWPRLGPRFRVKPAPVDRELSDGDEVTALGVGCTAVHTPGHTDGSCSLFVDGRLAFVGDLLSSPFGPRLQYVFATDWPQLPQSLARVKALQPELTFAGHGRRPVTSAALQSITPADWYTRRSET
jgi:glyoxylase-like metal-dependent hydrolase (beta-lactamase superfamily II)